MKLVGESMSVCGHGEYVLLNCLFLPEETERVTENIVKHANIMLAPRTNSIGLDA